LAFSLSSAEKPPVVEHMTQHKVELAGKTVNILSLHHGFSVLMRVLLIFIGLLASVFPKPRKI
ncbi:MAG: hypothetical protein MI748_18735, partial [Opitutales bacterium]|nr:hypothetical protein [Opitutales bacterium]